MTKPLYEVAHIIRDNWNEICHSAKINSHQIRMLNALKICRTVNLGWHIDKCNNRSCDHLQISYNSCRNRHCPKCQGKHREDWINKQYKKLLPVKYFHVVFTLPHQLNKLCLHQPKMMYSILFRAAWDTINTFALDPKHLGAQTGMTCILHTWGQNLSLHPHLHCIIPAGGINKKGKWKSTKSKGKYLFPVKALSSVFRAKYVHLLRKLSVANNVVIDQSIYDQLFQKNWVIYAKQPFLGPRQIIEYIGRYSHKIAISNHRIISTKNNQVQFKYKDYRHQGKNKIMTLGPLEFIRRFALHILPLRFVRIRHYGLFNGRYKMSTQEIVQAIEKNNTDIENIKIIIPIKAKDDNIHYPKCPKCQKGAMIIMAFGQGRDPPTNLNNFRKKTSSTKVS